jgi:hypothetical protein
MEANNTIPEIEEEKEVQLDSLSDVELDEMPPKRPRGRPKGSKAKPKPEPKPEPKVEQAKKGRPPKLQVPPPELDMNALTRMLAEHLAGEKQTARAKRHESWDSFF